MFFLFNDAGSQGPWKVGWTPSYLNVLVCSVCTFLNHKSFWWVNFQRKRSERKITNANTIKPQSRILLRIAKLWGYAVGAFTLGIGTHSCYLKSGVYNYYPTSSCKGCLSPMLYFEFLLDTEILEAKILNFFCFSCSESNCALAGSVLLKNLN